MGLITMSKKHEYKDLVIEHVGAQDAELAVAAAALIRMLAGPDVPPKPKLTPDIWHMMRCRDGELCACAICIWEKRHAPEFQEWENSRRFRPRPFASLPTFDRLLGLWAERTVYRSASGAMMDRAQDEAQAPEHSRTPWAVRYAEIAVEVERSVVWAYLPDHNRHGLVTAACVRALIASVRGLPVGGVAETKAVRSGRRGALVDLAARGLVQYPKNKRDQRAVDDRVAALAQTVRRTDEDQ